LNESAVAPAVIEMEYRAMTALILAIRSVCWTFIFGRLLWTMFLHVEH
jgi:hypothetical protein